MLYMNALSVPLTSSSPLVSAMPDVRVLPQSARWLLAKDRREEAIALLHKAALVNGRVLPSAVQVCVNQVRSLSVFSSLLAKATKYLYIKAVPMLV